MNGTEFNVKTPLVAEQEFIVEEKDTAVNQRSGEVNVLGTPRLLALMEEVSYKSVANLLPEGSVSVGTEMNIKHLKPSVVGEKLKCKSILREADGRKLVFDITVSDKRETVGEGTCTRFVVDKARFEQKAIKTSKES